MSNWSEHRIYKHLSEPVRFLSLTVDELGLVVIALVGCMQNTGNLYWQSIFVVTGLVGLLAVKRFKKHGVGVHLKSFLYWHGLMPSPSNTYPPFENRFYLP